MFYTELSSRPQDAERQFFSGTGLLVYSDTHLHIFSSTRLCIACVCVCASVALSMPACRSGAHLSLIKSTKRKLEPEAIGGQP